MDIVLISTQDRSTDWDEHTIGSEIVLGKRWNSKVMWVKWKLISVFFEIVLISTQDSAWFALSMHQMELLGDVGQVQGHFGSLGDDVNLGEIAARFALNVPWA
jgi:hypothetical protein